MFNRPTPSFQFALLCPSLALHCKPLTHRRHMAVARERQSTPLYWPAPEICQLPLVSRHSLLPTPPASGRDPRGKGPAWSQVPTGVLPKIMRGLVPPGQVSDGGSGLPQPIYLWDTVNVTCPPTPKGKAG